MVPRNIAQAAGSSSSGEWLLDGCASEHFVQRDTPGQVSGTRRPITEVISTANGDMTVTSVVDAAVPELGVLKECRELESGPNLVSLVKLIEDGNYEFSWNKQNGPSLLTADGQTVPSRVHNRVPVLDSSQMSPFALFSHERCHRRVLQ